MSEEKELWGENAAFDTEIFRRIISAGRFGPKTAKKPKIGKSTTTFFNTNFTFFPPPFLLLFWAGLWPGPNLV